MVRNWGSAGYFLSNRRVDTPLFARFFSWPESNSFYFESHEYAILHSRTKVGIFFQNRPLEPQFYSHGIFYSLNQLLRTWISLSKIFQGQMTILKFSRKSICRPSVVYWWFFESRFFIKRLKNSEMNLFESYQWWKFLESLTIFFWLHP